MEYSISGNLNSQRKIIILIMKEGKLFIKLLRKIIQTCK